MKLWPVKTELQFAEQFYMCKRFHDDRLSFTAQTNEPAAQRHVLQHIRGQPNNRRLVFPWDFHTAVKIKDLKF